MKKNYGYSYLNYCLPVLFLLLQLSLYGQEKVRTGTDQVTGVINSQITEIPFRDLPGNGIFSSDSGKFIINSKQELRKISSSFLLNFNFDKYTIIGVQGATGGCSVPSVGFTILKDCLNKKYIIESKIFVHGNCRLNLPYKRVIYTEKLQSDYSIEFNVKKQFE